MKIIKILTTLILLTFWGNKMFSQIKSDTIVVVLPDRFNINKLGDKIDFSNFYFRNDTMFYPNLKYTIKDTMLYRQNDIKIAKCIGRQFKFIDKSKRKIAVTKWNLEWFFGKYYQYYPSGYLLAQGSFSESSARVKINEWKYYFATGKIKKEEYYTSNGIKTGTWKTYNKKGKVIKEENYSQ